MGMGKNYMVNGDDHHLQYPVPVCHCPFCTHSDCWKFHRYDVRYVDEANSKTVLFLFQWQSPGYYMSFWNLDGKINSQQASAMGPQFDGYQQPLYLHQYKQETFHKNIIT